MKNYEDETIRIVNANRDRQKVASIENLNGKYEYAYYEEQPAVVKQKEVKNKGDLKEKVAAVILMVTLAAGGIAWNIAVDKRTDKLMDTYTDYLEVTEMTGQEVNEDTYNQYIENDGYPTMDGETRGGR